PGSGDELQGIKRGITELADIVVVNKADGELAPAATATAAEYASALRVVRPKAPGWIPRVVTCSARLGSGLDRLWETIEEVRSALGPRLQARRDDQARTWLWSEVSELLLAWARGDARAAGLARELEDEVVAGHVTAGTAARRI